MIPVSPNLQAFLATIRHSEGTDRAANPYRVVYGYGHTIVDLSDHPAVTGEWRGAPLDSLGPLYAGKISTAAGAYQIIKPTWLACKAQLQLPDFTGPSQDQAAALLIRQRGALELVNQGAFEDAVTRCATVWASLPGANAGQPERTLADLTEAYMTAGGSLA